MRTLKHALHGIIQTCWISHPSLRLELATQQELLYLSFCFCNFVNLLFTLNYICWLNCNQRTVEGIKLQRCWLYLCTSLLAQIKWPISPPIMAPFLKSLSLPGALPRSELIAEIVPSFHPSIPPNIQTISSGLFLLEFLSGLYKGRAVRDHFLVILISLLVWRSGGKMFHSYSSCHP